MKKINYAAIDLEEHYKEIILNSSKINKDKIKEFLLDFEVSESFEDLILLPIEKLICVKKISSQDIKAKYKLSDKDLNEKLREIKTLFNYKDLQKSELSNFFMSNANSINLRSCYYCNIDFVNTIIDFKNEYFDKYDLINNVESPRELELIIDIGEKRAEEIFSYKGKIKDVDDYATLLKPGIRNILDDLFVNGIINLKKLKTHNHFTLDHLFPQNGFVHFSLSLFNLIPSCYSCNSKFKKDNEIYDSINDILKISPSSNGFDEGFLKIDLNFNQGYKFDNCDKVENYKIKINSKYKNYVNLLKLQGRYNFHKNISFEMIEKRKKYSEKAIKDIAVIIGKDEISVKKDIFGAEVFEPKNAPFEKYKQDIAKQLGII